MEIVVAVLLLFGGFTLGSITTDNEHEKSVPTMVLPNVASVQGSHATTQIPYDSDLTRCHFDKPVIYRDLTVPFRSQIDRPGTEVSDCEVNGNCSYHSTAFPPSPEVKYPHE